MGARPRRQPSSRRTFRGEIAQVLVLIAAVASALAIFAATSRTTAGEGMLGVALSLVDQPAGSNSQPVRFAVHQGESAATIAANLQAAGLTDSSLRFQIVGRFHGGMGELRAGEYSLRATMRPSEIIEVMRGGIGTGWVTIPEGWRIADIADSLDSRAICSRDAFLEATTENYDMDFLRGRPQGSSLEGYLFPDTYQILPGATPRQVVIQMLTAFGQRFPPDLRAQSSSVGISPHQVIVLASIVEREAIAADERPIIAGVFLQRMRKGLKLQADPTVQYALAGVNPPFRSQGYWKAPLTSSDVTVNSPYNTYVVDGLPPGPIANPGLASIKAVLEAPATDYLYFVARPDGRHAFARTYKEHEENVAKYATP